MLMSKRMMYSIIAVPLLFVLAGANLALADVGSACTKLLENGMSDYPRFRSDFIGEIVDTGDKYEGRFTLYGDEKFRLRALTRSREFIFDSVAVHEVDNIEQIRCFKAPEECRQEFSALLKILRNSKSASDNANEELLLQCAAERVENYLASLPAEPVRSSCNENVLAVYGPKFTDGNAFNRTLDSLRALAPGALFMGKFSGPESPVKRNDIVVTYYSSESLECALTIKRMYPDLSLKRRPYPSRWDFKKGKAIYPNFEERRRLDKTVNVYVSEVY